MDTQCESRACLNKANNQTDEANKHEATHPLPLPSLPVLFASTIFFEKGHGIQWPRSDLGGQCFLLDGGAHCSSEGP